MHRKHMLRRMFWSKRRSHINNFLRLIKCGVFILGFKFVFRAWTAFLSWLLILNIVCLRLFYCLGTWLFFIVLILEQICLFRNNIFVEKLRIFIVCITLTESMLVSSNRTKGSICICTTWSLLTAKASKINNSTSWKHHSFSCIKLPILGHKMFILEVIFLLKHSFPLKNSSFNIMTVHLENWMEFELLLVSNDFLVSLRQILTFGKPILSLHI